MEESKDRLIQYDAERASKKKRALEEMVQESVLEYWKNAGISGDLEKAGTAASEIVSSFVKITPPEMVPDREPEIDSERDREGCYVVSGGGRGGVSVKPGNLLLNFHKLVTAIAAGGLTISGILGPWTALFAAIVLWDIFWSGLKVKISEREAVLLWAMWKDCDLNRHITEDRMFESVNRELALNGRQPVRMKEVRESLEILSEMGCIERVASIENKWWLCEWVKANY